MSWQETYDQVLASGVLKTSQRQRGLLAYLLEQKALGKLETIKEYSIAVDVFGRPEDFDPKIDSIVRAEMARLRKNLLIFNGQSQNFTLSLKNRSYDIKIVEKQAPLPTSNWAKKLKRLLFFAPVAALLLMIVSLGYWVLDANQPLTETFRMTVSVETEPYGDQPAELAMLSQLQKKLLIFISSSSYGEVTDKAHSDYHLSLSISENYLEVLGYDRVGKLVFSKNYNIDDFTASSRVDDLAVNVFTDGFDDLGVLTLYHGYNTLLSKPRRDLFRCYYQSLTQTLVSAPKFYEGDLLDCLDRNRTRVKTDQALISLQRADVYTVKYLKDLDYLNDHNAVRDYDLVLKADAELQLAARDFSHKPQHYYIMKIRLMRYEYPGDEIRLRQALEEFISAYPNDPVSAYIVMHYYGLYLNEWEAALQVANYGNTGGPLEASRLNELSAFYYLRTGQHELAKKRVLQITERESTVNETAWDIAFKCILFPEHKFHELRTLAKKHKLATRNQYIRYIQTRNYHQSNEDVLLQDAVVKHCPVFL